MAHATQMAFGQAVNLCDDARRFALDMARYGRSNIGFSPRSFSKVGMDCEDCVAVVRGGYKALPAPIIPASSATPLRNPIGKAIQASMLKRYGPSIADPEWTVEDHRPLRNRR